jgi:metal-responsive CopG/Arc/MetJ family transcriptional regulator
MTLELPTELIQATERAIAQGKVTSLNELIARALRRELSMISQTSSSKSQDDPIWELGTNPVVCDVTDASENLDRYLYNSL